MVNQLSLPLIRLFQRLSMFLTFLCCAYVVFFLYFKKQDTSNSINNSNVETQKIAVLAPSPLVDLNYMGGYSNGQARDIFTIVTDVQSTGNVDSTPKGQLPDHLKVVGLIIGHPSQIIIEDSMVNQTYFIEEGKPQAGINIVKVDPDKMIINYQGQSIPIPVTKD